MKDIVRGWEICHLDGNTLIRLHCHLNVISRDLRNISTPRAHLMWNSCTLKHFLLQGGAPATPHSYSITRSLAANAFRRTFLVIFRTPVSEACRSSQVWPVGDSLVAAFRLLVRKILTFALSGMSVIRSDGNTLATRVLST